MKGKLVRYQKAGAFHFITFSCFRRQPLGAGPGAGITKWVPPLKMVAPGASLLGTWESTFTIPSFLSQPQNRMSIRQTSPSPSKNPAPNLQSISPLRRTMESVSEIRNRPMPCQSDHEPLIRGRVPPTPPPPFEKDLRFSTKSLQMIEETCETSAARAARLQHPACLAQEMPEAPESIEAKPRGSLNRQRNANAPH